ncbi:hypothetical protein [Accumulibacter sp.]|uniref:hypothetical protein n=1 Tax=Accumulibacter sp. TaxID=2053492 RepID=UPI002B92DB9D|nr:hypothetical protein [Accumulibacter sp.]HRF06292.1 hypothetical protein [Accumulibacter sp.]
MAAPNETKVLITGDASGAVAAIGRVRAELGSLQSLSAKAFAIGGAIGATGIVAALTDVTKKVIDAGDELSKLSQKTGLSVEDLGKLQYAADLSGVSTEQLGKGLAKLDVEIAAAGAGSEKSSKLFASLGIGLRNADGRLRSTGDVLADLADRFQQMPDGVGKTALAVDIFGEKLGARMIPLLNAGRDGLQAMGDEAEALGIVIGTKLAKDSEAFNDNLTRLQKMSAAAGISLGNSLLPSLNELLKTFIDFRSSNINMADLAFGVSFADKTKAAIEQVDLIGKKLEALRKQAKAAKDGEAIDLQYEIERQERLLSYFQKQAGVSSSAEIAENEKKNAARRIALQTDLQAKLADLEQLKTIAAGKASADILLDDAKRTEKQIQNAEKLRDALRTAWRASIEDARKAGEEAVKLLDKAANTRQAGADKASDIRRSGLSEADQEALAFREFRPLVEEAEFAATSAKFAAMHGRVENAAKLADEATKKAERAERLTDSMTIPEERARSVERATEVKAAADEARAKIKQQEAATLDEQATSQAAALGELETKLSELQAHAAEIALTVQIDQAQAAIAQITADLEAIPNKTVYVDVVTRNSGGALADANAGFWTGGYTGPGGRFQPAGIVHKDEFVTSSPIVRQPGVLAFLYRLQREGARALPGYAGGGLVGNINPGALRMPSAAPARAAATFVVPGLGSYPTSVDGYTFGRLERDFARAALQKGGRK